MLIMLISTTEIEIGNTQIIVQVNVLLTKKPMMLIEKHHWINGVLIIIQRQMNLKIE